MDIRQLRNFCLISKTGSLRKAAADLHVAQPGLSRQVSMLERELGVQLLVRTGRGVTLTAAGGVFAERLEVALGLLDEAREEIRALALEPTGQLVIGVPASLSVALAARPLAEFRTRFPRISLRLIEAQPITLHEWLEAGRLDVALLYDDAATHAHTVRELFEDELFIVGPFDDDSLGKAVPFEGLERLPLIVPGPHNGLRIQLDERARGLGFELRVTVEVDSLGVQKELIKRGLGYGILPLLAVESEVKNAALKVAHLTPVLRRKIVFATPAHKRPAPAVEQFIDLVTMEVEAMRSVVEFPC